MFNIKYHRPLLNTYLSVLVQPCMTYLTVLIWSCIYLADGFNGIMALLLTVQSVDV